MKLGVWKDGRRIATLSETRNRMSLTYASGAGQLGTPLISVSMPVSTAPYTDRVVRPYFNGLLPEGQSRLVIAYDFGIDATDDMKLLSELGRDCAGALVVLPDNEAPDGIESTEAPEQLDDDEIERRINALPSHPLGVTSKIRASLPGVQSKLLLTNVAGNWCTPDATHPSTHILKPGISELPHSVVNEAFCLTVAALAGLRAATTTVAQFHSTSVLVSERFDRQREDDGTIGRLHQEDACQALSILTRTPKQKYQSFGGPNLGAIARLLNQWGGDTRELLRQITFSVLVGNADHHGKNLSFLHSPDGVVDLAPVYDVMCTTYYDGSNDLRHVDTELGLHIGSRTDIFDVTVDDLVDEARGWGMRPGTALEIVTGLVERTGEAITQVMQTFELEVPDAIVQRVADRTLSFL
jgi:serine/threonine-protein kinase HipA